MEQGLWPVVVVVLLGSLLAVMYVWKLVEVAYFHKPIDGDETVREAPFSILLPTWLLVVANVYFGINTDFTVNVSEIAVFSLFGVSP